MKKLKLLFGLLFLLSIMISLTSCEKQQYCASCYESYSGYTADDFCGDSESVDAYIEDLEGTTFSGGFSQSWSCSKSLK